MSLGRGGMRGAAALATLLAGGGCALAQAASPGTAPLPVFSPSILDPAGPIGAAQRTILINAVVIMLAIIVPTIVATIAFAWWYRASNPRAHYRPDWAYSGRVELLVWAVPLLVILFLGGITWVGSHDLDPGRPVAAADGSSAKPLPVQVVSLDWKWLFIYPEQGVASVNELVVPVGAPLPLSITSASVMNGFFVPHLGTMIYGMNGMAVGLNLRADRPGVYHGLSTHMSGDGFSDMHFDVKVVPTADFEAWVAGARAAGGRLDQGAYAELAKQSVAWPRPTYGSVDADLFQAVVMQKIPPGPGPDKGQPNPGVTPKPLAGGPAGDATFPDAPICTPSRPDGLRTVALRAEK